MFDLKTDFLPNISFRNIGNKPEIIEEIKVIKVSSTGCATAYLNQK